jgi:citrate synthase
MTMQYDNLEDKLSQLVEYTKDSGKIDLSLYTEYDVKRGLRDSTGKGVLTGLTEISDVIGLLMSAPAKKFRPMAVSIFRAITSQI